MRCPNLKLLASKIRMIPDGVRSHQIHQSNIMKYSVAESAKMYFDGSLSFRL
jgi:hypothetical protein